MAISIAGWITHWIIYFRFFLANHASVKQIENNTRKTFESENAPQILPSNFSSNPKLSIKKEILESQQRWEVFHVKPKSGKETKKVVVYWHGGAFIKGTSPKHWDAVARVVTESHCPVVVPIYTLAPLSTAREWNIVALDFITKLSKDPRYTDYQIVLMGDSAGGWMTMRLLQAMCEVSCGEKSDQQEDVDRALMRMGTGIMISPFINSEVTDELIEASKSDCWLCLNLFTFVSRLWVNGPAEFPALLEAMPKEANDRYTTLEKHHLYSGEVCLDHNIDIFKTYIKLHPEHGPFRFSTSIGTADMCHGPVLRMQKTFDAMDDQVVVSDTIVEEGLYHVYALLSTPEAEKAWTRIRQVLAA